MFGARMRFLLATAIAVVALVPATAQAVSPLDVGMQTLYNADGSGRLFATGGSQTWERCNADLSVCEAAGSGIEIGTGTAPDGSVFRLAGNGPGPVWHGNLRIGAPPTVQGTLSANELVTPVRAAWLGGWEGSGDQTQLAVCQTPTGEGCTSISDPKYLEGCPSGGAVLDPSFAGEYLRIADLRFGPGAVDTLEAYTSPFGRPILPAQGNIAVAIVGQIAPATHERTATCGPKPQVEAWISSRGVAKVSCAFGCAATLIAGHAGRAIRTTLQVPGTGKPLGIGAPQEPQSSGSTLAIASAVLKGLGGGRTNFAVEVGGQIFARESIVLPAAKKPAKHRKHKKHRHHKGTSKA